MARLILREATAKTDMAEVRPKLDQMMSTSLDSTLVSHHWQGDVLHLSGPGARGQVTYEPGELVVNARLSLPASLFRSVIEQKLRAALHEAAR